MAVANTRYELFPPITTLLLVDCRGSPSRFTDVGNYDAQNLSRICHRLVAVRAYGPTLTAAPFGEIWRAIARGAGGAANGETHWPETVLLQSG